MTNDVVLQVFEEIGWRSCGRIGASDYFFDLRALGALSHAHVAIPDDGWLHLDWHLRGVIDGTRFDQLPDALELINRGLTTGLFRLRDSNYGLLFATRMRIPESGLDPQVLRQSVVDSLETIDLCWNSVRRLLRD